MISMANSKSQQTPIDLTDEFVEYSLVIQATLGLLYDREVACFKDDKLYHHVIEFARKYDMAIILKTISKELRVHATSPEKGVHVLQFLRLAIDLGGCDLITAIIRAKSTHTWPQRARDPSTSKCGGHSIFPQRTLTLPEPVLTDLTQEFIPTPKPFDLGSWPYASFAALPPPIAWALLRADLFGEAGYRSGKFRNEAEAFERNLERILSSMCESGSRAAYQVSR
jgi:hypothetical protein